ncbi:parvulin-like peptidyl-prolyl isomerase [Oceanococcus atlanticus]|uniref:Periplasmic chaperone PpiD n=1 Tax=Oceanococcus atlanticus TaxID=1317117 RepID=A0A1Y1SD81_9GAMM|nr:SurA N-terminal domain-containing protein [Oceanococcus atlanticus]ORE86955.1 parvulin-like peptidyl-prolyl isomerase [Oceanococcus atlanticus]
MLQNIRDRATGPLAWFIVGIICIPFAFFGIEAFRSDGAARSVAKVEGQEISEAALQQRYQQRYQQLQQMLGENFRPDMINPDMLRESVLQGMIQEAVTGAYLADRSYRVADETVLATIRGEQAFQQNGHFSPTLYRDTLARQGMNPVQYEDRVRAFLTDQQLRQAVTNSVIVTEAELASEWAIDRQTRRFNHRIYNAKAVEASISIDDAAVEARYEERKASLIAPERVRVSYVELDQEVLKQKVDVTPEALQALYDEQKETRFKVAEERKARHILVRASEDNARAKIDAAAERVAAGEDFAEVAKEVSQDPGSKNKGGDLGWVSTGMMVAPFEDALFALDTGVVSEPVETQFGWHLIQVEEIRPERLRGFDEPEVQTELEDMYREREARAEFDALADKLEQVSFENPASLDPVAEQLGLEIKTSEWMTRDGGAGIGASDAVIAAAFSDLVLNAGENSLPLNVGRRQIVLRVAEHEEERPQTLDEVRADLVEALTREAVAEKLQAMADADRTKLAEGKSLADLPAQDGAENQKPVTAERGDSAPARVIIATVFGMDVPQEGASSYETAMLPNGNLALIELTDVTDGNWAEAIENEKEATKRRLLSQRANQEYMALQAALRAQADVKVFAATF